MVSLDGQDVLIHNSVAFAILCNFFVNIFIYGGIVVVWIVNLNSRT